MSKAVISGADLEAIRASLLDDPFLFAKVVCGHRDLSDSFHRPLAYLMAGCTDKLLSLLRDPAPPSYVVRALRSAIADRHGLDWRDPNDRDAIDRLLRFINLRVYRGAGKSSLATSIALWRATKDPDVTMLICSGAEERAISFVRQIRRIILQDEYRTLFADRVPDDIATCLTEKKILLKGRTVNSPQATIEGWGYESKLVGAHFDEFILDDLVGPENCSPLELSRVHRFLSGLVGFYNPAIKRPIRRLHVGTRYDEQDDSYKLEEIPNCLSFFVPIEEHQGEIIDLTIPGTPTNPEPNWHTAEKIAAIRETVLSDPEEGAPSWRKNYLLDPAAGGGRIFPPNVVDGAIWHKDINPRTKALVLTRVKRHPVSKVPLLTPKGEPDLWRFELSQLYTVIGVDQSFTDSGDEWAVSAVAADPYGVRYQLDTKVGHGFDAMWEMILVLALKWKPRRIGIESGAAQGTATILKSREEKFSRIRGLIEPVSHGSKPKLFRIQNNLAEPLKMGRYLLNPEDIQAKAEMKLYRGPTSRAKDNILDSLAIADMILHKGLPVVSDAPKRPRPPALDFIDFDLSA